MPLSVYYIASLAVFSFVSLHVQSCAELDVVTSALSCWPFVCPSQTLRCCVKIAEHVLSAPRSLVYMSHQSSFLTTSVPKFWRSHLYAVRTSAIKHTIKQLYVLLYVLLQLCEDLGWW